MKIYITYILVPKLLVASILSDDCVYEVCSCDDMYINCDRLGLKAVPPLLEFRFGQYENLVFDMNLITSIPASSLPTGLTQISLQDNPIATIDDNAFIGSANTLQTLIFASARFTKIPNALSPLKTLINLDIYDTNITDWNFDVMKKLGSTIQNLVLKAVPMLAWPNWIHSFVNMTELSIISCNLTAIPDDALDTVASTLVSLTLTGNSLTTVPKALSKLTALQMLYIDANQITDTRWLPASRTLSDLSLNNNNIFNASQLSESLRLTAGPISDLDITNNKLREIPDIHFLRLEGIDLSNNMISDPNSGTLPADLFRCDMDHNFLPSIPSAVSSLVILNDLRLSSNSIREIDGAKLPTNVTFLDLGYNLITDLTDTSFTPNSILQTLYLNNNPIATISSYAFRNLPKLMELNLGNTKLTRLPLALSSLKKLDMLDVSGVPGLVCTCLEKSLEPLLRSLSSEKLWGECGRLSVHDFFWMLSPSCP